MSNKIKIFVFLLCLNSLLFFLGYVIWGKESLIVLIFLALGLNFFFFFFPNRNILSYFPKMREVEGQDPWNLIEIATYYAKKAKIPPPKIMILETQIPQALSIGRSMKGGYLLLTEGLLEKFNSEEIKAIVAYQMACISRLETFLYSIIYLLCALFFSCTFFVDSIIGWFFYSEDQKDHFFPHKFHSFTALCLPLLLLPLRFLIPRSNYFHVDKLAVSYMDDPHIFAQVLWKMGSYSSTQPFLVPPKMDHFFIVSTLNTKGWLKCLCSHPPISKRIQKLIGNTLI